MDGKILKQSAGYCALLIALLLGASRCEEETYASQFLTFILPANILPSDSIVLVGDTLWITADVSDSLIEFNTNKKYSLPNFDFGQTSIGIRKLVDAQVGLSDQLSAVSKFDLIEDIGEITFPGETFIDFKYKYDITTKKYHLSIGIIPKEKGVFCITFLGPTNLNYRGFVDLGKHSSGATIVPLYEDLVFPINDGANNFELFKENCLDQSEGPPENYRSNYRFVTFTFKVL